jgi:hypothetical protein
VTLLDDVLQPMNLQNEKVATCGIFVPARPRLWISKQFRFLFGQRVDTTFGTSHHLSIIKLSTSLRYLLFSTLIINNSKKTTTLSFFFLENIISLPVESNRSRESITNPTKSTTTRSEKLCDSVSRMRTRYTT